MKAIVSHQKKMILSGLVILGVICAAIGKPTTDDNDADDPMLSDTDYQYDDGVVSQSPEVPADVMKSTVPPYLTMTEYTRSVRPGEDAKLECPVKNLSGTNVILWKNETNLASQMLKAANSRLEIDGNYTLTIHNTTEWDSRVYSCIIFPQNLTVHVKLVVSDQIPEPKESSTATESTPSSGCRQSLAYLTFLTTALMTLLIGSESLRRI